MAFNLEVNLSGIKCKNPVMVASGTYGYGFDFSKFYDPKILGAVISKGITRYKKDGNDGIRIWETQSGIINSIGLENKGVEDFVKNKLSDMNEIDTNIFVNLGSNSINEYLESIEILNDYDFSAVELNISCPNVKEGGMAFGICADDSYRVVKEVMKATRHKVFVKLSPNARDITETALAVEEAGADGITLVNTFLAMEIDFDRRSAVFDNLYAGLSGPAIFPIALRMVHQVANSVKIPVIAIGGIKDYKDALKYIFAGATAVQIGTLNFMNPYAARDIINDMENYLRTRDEDINDLIGII